MQAGLGGPEIAENYTARIGSVKEWGYLWCWSGQFGMRIHNSDKFTPRCTK